MQEMYKKYRELREKIEAIGFAMNVISWDAQTEAPPKSVGHRSKIIGLLTKEILNARKDSEFIQVVEELHSNMDQLDHEQQREIYEEKRGLDKMLKIPQELLIQYSQLRVKAEQIWAEARQKQDFKMFEPILTEVIEMVKKMTAYTLKEGQTIYDSLLDDFERGMTVEKYNVFFDQLKKDLVPFVLEVCDTDVDYKDDFMKYTFDEARQKEFVEYLMDVFPFDKSRGLLKKSVHPFTWGTSPNDVRFTVRYLEDFFFSSIFAGAHELGHALHSQGVDDAYTGRTIAGIASLGIGESQSRFYENIIARSKAFWETHYGKLQEVFQKELGDVSLEDFYKVANKVERSFIRVEADELTYPLHIMVRFEIEQGLFNGDIEVKDLPKVWNQKMKDYLGIVPSNDSEGVLQDVHWSFGLFGYFPTYAYGSAISSQLASAMSKTIDIDQCIRENKLDVVNDWLVENVHKFGGVKLPDQIVKDATGEPFNAKYYIEYLKEKYTVLLKG